MHCDQPTYCTRTAIFERTMVYAVATSQAASQLACVVRRQAVVTSKWQKFGATEDEANSQWKNNKKYALKKITGLKSYFKGL